MPISRLNLPFQGGSNGIQHSIIITDKMDLSYRTPFRSWHTRPRKACSWQRVTHQSSDFALSVPKIAVRATMQLDPLLIWSTDEKVRKCKFPVLKFGRMAWMTNPKGRKIPDFLYLDFWTKSGATSDVSIGVFGQNSLVFQGGSSCIVDRFWLDCLTSHFGLPHSREVELFRKFWFFGCRWFFSGWDALSDFSRNQLRNA